jgi:hypothetical protein
MQIKSLLNSPMGKIFISILLGLGLATMFRTVCEGKNCIQFVGPVISEVDGKIYKHGEKCYKYVAESSGKCDETKRVVDIRAKPKDEGGTFGF